MGKFQSGFDVVGRNVADAVSYVEDGGGWRRMELIPFTLIYSGVCLLFDYV